MKNSHYVENVLGQMETFYDVLPHHLLKLVRINCTTPLYSGNDKVGNPMANWAIDTIIKLLQKYYHQMLKENTFKGWLGLSHNLMSLSKE